MNDPKVLQIIAEKACQFDRAHFDDDVPVVFELLLANHEQLPQDRKLITRLRPRYAVALGFFEGYAQAVNVESATKNNFRHAIGAKPEENVFEALGRMQGEFGRKIEDLKDERDKLQTKLAEAERTGAEHAAQLEDEIRALVAERDRYKREATESKSVVKLIGYWRDVAQSNTIGEGFRDGLESCVKDLERAIEEDESKNQTNIGIVIKPPPPPPPAAPPPPNELRTEIDDELAQAAVKYANAFMQLGSSSDDLRNAKSACSDSSGSLKTWLESHWAFVINGFVHGARWQLSRIENAHTGNAPTMHFPPASDRASMPSDCEIAELVCRTIYSGTETSEAFIRRIADEIKGDDPESIRRKVVATYGSVSEVCAIKFALLYFRDRLVGPANEVQNAERTQYETTIRQKNERIAELEKQLGFDCIGGTEKGEGVEAKLELEIQKQNELLRSQNADLNKARSRIAELEEQLKDEIENLNETARENVKLANDASELRASIVGYFQNEHRSNSASLAARNHLRSLVGLSSSRSATPAVAASKPELEACNAIVFRDDAESGYWEEMSCVLASKKDTTSQSVATAADEMVEERRKRLPVRIGSENDTRTVIIGVRVADEVTDELLLEAAKFAASMVESAPGADDLDMARSAVSLPFLHVHRWTARSWGLLVRGYVNGAQRSSRKP